MVANGYIIREGADLYETDLRGANLRAADLYAADLRGANLRGADLYTANLRGADLRGADLYTANLREANLRAADLREANLIGANLRGADLIGANLYGANLYGANLYGAKGIWSFQCGEYNRVNYCIQQKYNNIFIIGCFYGTAKEALVLVRKKYGIDSDYEKLINIYNNMK